MPKQTKHIFEDETCPVVHPLKSHEEYCWGEVQKPKQENPRDQAVLEEFDKHFSVSSEGYYGAGNFGPDEMKKWFLQKLQEERELWQVKNAGLYRQLFAEMEKGKTFTARKVYL